MVCMSMWSPGWISLAMVIFDVVSRLIVCIPIGMRSVSLSLVLMVSRGMVVLVVIGPIVTGKQIGRASCRERV